ncbi:hypothetical protein EDC04DRAFT_1241916 [Pisolithus marmoratus]|nr:hypothetical protein EDC04DRAFT_1241916 [Pisolithus marmoratus]
MPDNLRIPTPDNVPMLIRLTCSLRGISWSLRLRSLRPSANDCTFIVVATLSHSNRLLHVVPSYFSFCPIYRRSSNGSTTRLSQSLPRQQDCYLHIRYDAASSYGYAIKQSQAPECVVSSPGDNISCPPGWSSTECLSRFVSIFSSSRFLIPGRGELPTSIVVAGEGFPLA